MATNSNLCSTPCYTRGVAEEITQRELRNDSGEIMRRLDAGVTFIVTRNGVPVGELTPLRRHRFVAAAGRKARGARAVDLLIAATALAAELPLYTRNGDDFIALDGLVDIHVV